MSRKLEEMKSCSNSQISQAIEAAICEKVMPQLQLSLEGLGRGSNAKEDLRSTWLKKNPLIYLDCGKHPKQPTSNLT